MGNDVITNKSEQVVGFLTSLERMLNSIEAVLKIRKPLLNGEHYISDAELSKRLKISRRSLQEYRSAGKIPYYQFGHRILYKESEIQKMLDDGFKEPFGKE